MSIDIPKIQRAVEQYARATGDAKATQALANIVNPILVGIDQLQRRVAALEAAAKPKSDTGQS